MNFSTRNSKVVVFAWLTVAATACAQQEEPVPRESYSCSGQPVIDMHVHAATEELISRFRGAPPFLAAAANPTNEVPPGSADEYLHQTMAVMDQCNVVRAFVSGNVEAVESWYRASQERVIPSLAMQHFEDAQLPGPDELRALYRGGELRGLGEVGALYAGLSPSDPGYATYYALAEEFDVPVGIHTGVGAPGSEANAQFGNPELLEDVLERFPRLRVNMMHGGVGWPEEAQMIMESHPQVYMDYSPIWQFWPGDEQTFREHAEEINRLYAQGLGERIMFGTDNGPIPAHIGMAIEMIEANPYLSDERKRDILYNNAARFLRLSEEQVSSDHGR